MFANRPNISTRIHTHSLRFKHDVYDSFLLVVNEIGVVVLHLTIEPS